ncbi:MAG: outer membrane protein transport protein [Proteobacteria bacterium]|nr:outer membrane protein transport protein [Pseudomonadota bacterium]
MNSIQLPFPTKMRLFYYYVCLVCSNYAAYGNGALPLSAGANNTGLAGAGIAQPLEATGANLNPALLGYLDNQVSISVGVAHQNQKANTSHSNLVAGTPLPPQTGAQRNGISNIFPAFAGVAYHVHPEWSVGVSLSGGGGRTKYNSSLISPVIKTSTKFESEVMLAPLSLAWKPKSEQSYGLSLIIGRSSLVTNFTLPNGMNSKGKNKTDTIYGLGGRIGGLWDVAKFLTLGATFTTPIYFQKYHKYNDLIKHRFVVPMRVGMGTSWHLSSCTDVLVDAEGYFWGKTKGTGDSPAKGGLGWKNTYAVKLGINHHINPEWTMRMGYSYNQTPVPRNEVLFSSFSPALAIITNSLAAGASYQVSQSFSLNLNALYGFKNKIRDNGTGVLKGKAKGVTLSSQVTLVMFGFTYLY